MCKEDVHCDSRCDEQESESAGYRPCNVGVVGVARLSGKLVRKLKNMSLVECSWKGRP